jgi:hypothetical protein
LISPVDVEIEGQTPSGVAGGCSSSGFIATVRIRQKARSG